MRKSHLPRKTGKAFRIDPVIIFIGIGIYFFIYVFPCISPLYYFIQCRARYLCSFGKLNTVNVVGFHQKIDIFNKTISAIDMNHEKSLPGNYWNHCTAKNLFVQLGQTSFRKVLFSSQQPVYSFYGDTWPGSAGPDAR